MNNIVVIALLDKEWPPEHSFVDGMLAGKAIRDQGLSVQLCVSKNALDDSSPRRYKHASCLPVLHSRRGFGRIQNFWVAIRMIAYLSKREKIRGQKVVLFVRNDPIYLLAGSIMRARIDRLIFQSSFPHEEYSGNFIKRGLAKLLYKLAGRNVDAVTGVSPEGVARAKVFCPSAKVGEYIPLLSDLHFGKCPCNESLWDFGRVPTFVYIGTHCNGREIDLVLKAIVAATRAGTIARYLFVGATQNDEVRLGRVDGVEDLVQKNIVTFIRPVRRKEIPKILNECDIGMTLIPPKPVYYESSPTKLAEYMGAGLAILASRGIPMQERFVTESGCGVLVEWSVDEIAQALENICGDVEEILTMKISSKKYAKKNLQYTSYVSSFLKLIK